MVRPMLTPQERERGRLLGARLREARGERSMTEVAGQAGVPVETLRKIESGRIPTPAFFTVAALATALHIELADLAAVDVTEAQRELVGLDDHSVPTATLLVTAGVARSA